MKIKFIFVSALLAANAVHAEPPVIEAGESKLPIELNQQTPTQQFVVAEDKNDQADAKSSDVIAQITALQDELQKLRGQLEMQAHQIQQLKQQQSAFYQDIDGRLNKTANTTVAESAPVIVADKNQGDGHSAYNMAYNLVRAKQYNQAITAMNAFIQAYPNSPYAPNAHYWLGELYLSQTLYDKAIAQFNLLIKNFPDSGKVAGAHLKLGFAYYDKSDWAGAKRELSLVKSDYPDTAVAEVAKARLHDMERQGL